METALRQIIGGQQLKKPPGVKHEKPYLKYALCDICPSMWSLGYLQSISSRSQLIPKIANILSASVGKHAQSPSLRRKLAKLSLLCQKSSDNGNDGSASGTKSLQTVEPQLLKMMRLSLYNPTASRRLPLSPVPDVEDQMADGKKSVDNEDDIEGLIGTYHQAVMGEIYFDEELDEFEDLFEDEDGTIDEFEDLLENEENGNGEFEDLLEVEEGRGEQSQDLLEDKGGGRSISSMDARSKFDPASDSIFRCGRTISTAWHEFSSEWEDVQSFDMLEEEDQDMLL